MASAHGSLLLPIKAYIFAYVSQLRPAGDPHVAAPNGELRQTIAELENVQKHPVQRVRVERLAATLRQRAQRLQDPAETPDAEPGAAGQALAVAFGDYIDEMIGYLDHAGELRREQLTLLIGDLVADLKPLALRQDDEQLHALAERIGDKRAQLSSLQRPWQSEVLSAE